MEDAVDLDRLVSWFQDAEHQSYAARELAERDRDYYDGKQLTDEEVNALRKRGQPPIVINRIKRKLDWLMGLEAQRRTDPRAFPRTPKHEQAAEAATDAIKFVCDNQNWDWIKASVFQNMLIEGFGGCEVTHREKRNGETEIVINYYPWDRLFYDPHSSRSDFSDARYLGAMVWKDAAVLKEDYPEAAEVIEATLQDYSGTYEDKPRSAWAVSTDRKRIRVVLMYWREKGEWRWCKFVGDAKLEDGVSPYVDEDGDSMCGLILQSAYVDRDNNRYGVVRGMIDAQDEINKRRSKALHLLTQRQTVGEKGAVSSIAHMKRELARPDGHVEVTPGMRFDLLTTTDLASGQLSMLQEAKAEIDLMGANAALAGEDGASASGRAVLAKQQGGMVEIAPIMDRLQMFSREVYRHVWARVRQFWTEERWIRVTDEERNARFVGLNRPLTVKDALMRLPEDERMAVVQAEGLAPGDPRLDQVISTENEVAQIEVDIVLDEVPDAVTLQGETFEQLVQLATSGAVPIPGELLVESAPGLRRDMKDKIVEAIQQREQAMMQAQQGTAQAEAAKAAAEARKLEAETLETQADAAESMADAQLKAREAAMPLG